MVQCGKCHYWTAAKDNPNWGECHRNAPVPELAKGAEHFITPGTHRVIWPYTRAVDTCGQGEAGASKAAVLPQEDTPALMDPNSGFNKAVQSARNRIRP